MLNKPKRDELFRILVEKGISLHLLAEPIEAHDLYELRFKENPCFFRLTPHGNPLGINYNVESMPRTEVPNPVGFNWQGAKANFSKWADDMSLELESPDLWVKTAQLFAPTAAPSDDKFTRTELAEVQGQLRLLQLSFTQAALPEAAKQKLIELTETAAVKAEGLTKKDWQNWIIGGFISAITGLALNPTQAGEVLKLVKAAFGGLFLH